MSFSETAIHYRFLKHLDFVLNVLVRGKQLPCCVSDISVLQAEGREESESDEEAEADEADADAETAALMAAEGDGAQVISMEEATVQDQGEICVSSFSKMFC